jgi:hypothetical protein
MSKWLQGTQMMNVTQFLRLAGILDVGPEDLLFPPPAGPSSSRMRELASIISNMDAADLEAFLAVGRSMANRKS